MAYSYLNFAEDVLNEAPRPLLPIEIWEFGKTTTHFSKLNTTGKTPHASLAARLYVDVRDKPETTKFIKVTSDPARFFLKTRQSEIIENFDYETDIIADVSKDNYIKKINIIKERDLHPILAYFAYTNRDFNKGKYIYTKTVYHEKSKKNSLNQWTHPDMVGFSTPLDDWDREVINLNRITDNDLIKIYSFELKKSIDRTNYREYFFQAVSNSSWAHEGYLVASNIDIEDPDLKEELERLTQSFGIGIIYLDLDDVDSSKIIYQPKSKDLLDWKTINKMCKLNIDFKNFIKDIKNDVNNEEIKKYNYDTVEEDISLYLEKIINKK